MGHRNAQADSTAGRASETPRRARQGHAAGHLRLVGPSPRDAERTKGRHHATFVAADRPQAARGGSGRADAERLPLERLAHVPAGSLRLVGVVTGASPAPSFIPGSVAVHVGDVLTASFAPVEPIAFAASMMMHGIGDADWIVAYDAVPSTTPASEAFVRALRHYGHPRAFVLEGGLAAHRRAGLPTTRLPIAVAPSSFTARAPKSSA